MPLCLNKGFLEIKLRTKETTTWNISGPLEHDCQDTQKADRAFWALGTPRAHPRPSPLKSGRPYMQRSGPRGMPSFPLLHAMPPLTSCQPLTPALPLRTLGLPSISRAQATGDEDEASHLPHPPTIEVNGASKAGWQWRHLCDPQQLKEAQVAPCLLVRRVFFFFFFFAIRI